MIFKKFLLSSIICVSGLYSVSSQAACTFLSGSAGDSETIDFGKVIVQRDAPVGTIIADIWATTSFSGRGNFIQCDATGSQFTTRWSTEGLTARPYTGGVVLDVGVAGVGLGIGFSTPYGSYGSGAFPRDMRHQGCLTSTDWSRFCGNSWGRTHFQLVKTAQTTGSGPIVLPGRIRASIVNQAYTYAFNFGTTSSINTVACSVKNTAIRVPMGNVQRNTFTGVGHMGDPVPFYVQLDCDAATRVNITVDATADGANVPGVMAIDTSATGNAASGVGIQLTRAGAPVNFGSLIPVGTMPRDGEMAIPFVARYYQTSTTVTPGAANATATFTMTYN